MDSKGFSLIVDSVVAEFYNIAKTDPVFITSCKSGDDFELCVVDVTNRVLCAAGIDAVVHHTPGSHAFPDVIVEFATGEKYGIEVKSSSAAKSKGWKINGNSVMGSTRDDSVIDTYIIFGKTAKTALAFKARRYEESVANVVVTHSPRYLIDLELDPSETFFEKSGIGYKELVNSENPIGLITSYFQAQGQKAWWLAESTPAAVRMFSDASVTEQYECFGYGLAHFPELFERNSTKYKRFALWLATERSLVSPSLRDDFSAGGQVSLIVNGTPYNKLPQIFKRLVDYRPFLIKALESADNEVLCNDWGLKTIEFSSLEEKLKRWVSIVAPHVNENQLQKDVKPYKLLYDIVFEEFD